MSKPMSETIEERYAGIRRELERDGCFRAIYLLDDLMAERGKKVNLDEIFPKEVMEKAYQFDTRVNANGWDRYHLMAKTPRLLIHKIRREAEDLGEVEIVACSAGCGKELARVRVRLGLTVEIVEDK